MSAPTDGDAGSMRQPGPSSAWADAGVVGFASISAAARLTAVILRNLAIVLLLAVQHLFIAGSSTVASMAQLSVAPGDPRLFSHPVPQGFWTLSHGITSSE
jgi:hypothetical protein